MKRTVSAETVARAVGVSRSAVSRAFSENAYISEKKRTLIIDAAARLGYRPDAIARSLVTRNSGMIGVVVTDLDNPFFTRLLERVCRGLSVAGFGVMFEVADRNTIGRAVQRLLSYQVQGLIFAAFPNYFVDQVAPALSERKPVVLLDRKLEGAAVDWVIGDSEMGGRLAGEHLISIGCRNLGLISVGNENATAAARQTGFIATLAEHGVRLVARLRGAPDPDGLAMAAREVLSQHPRPDGIFCDWDMIAITLRQIAEREFGLRVPEDLAIVGYDNSPAAGWIGNDITSIDQDVNTLADAAVDLLVRRLQDRDAALAHVISPVRLVKRGSTARRA